jgi:hypothetical protein
MTYNVTMINESTADSLIQQIQETPEYSVEQNAITGIQSSYQLSENTAISLDIVSNKLFLFFKDSTGGDTSASDPFKVKNTVGAFDIHTGHINQDGVADAIISVPGAGKKGAAVYLQILSFVHDNQ